MRRSTRSNSAAARAKVASDKAPAKKTIVKKAKIEKKAVSVVVKEKKAVAVVVKEKKGVKAEIVESNSAGEKIEIKAIATQRLVTIEACKSWGAFKSRVSKIQKGLGSKALVEINKEKPGKGNFVVKVSGTEEPIVELLQMKRPFSSLKALDMDDVIKQILNAVEG